MKYLGRGLLVLYCLLAIACKDTSIKIDNQGNSGSASAQVATVSGEVRDTQGVPLVDVHVVTIPFGRAIETDAAGRKIIESVVTDSEGRFLIADVAQGSYKLLFLGSGYIKSTLALGPVDFIPENLVDGVIQKSVVLEMFPEAGDGDNPPVALFDPEDKKRMTEILVSRGIRFTNVVNNIESLDAANFKTLVVGHDATVFTEISQLIAAKEQLDDFLENNGSIYMGQLNDFSVESTPMPFFVGDRQYVLHTEEAPFNDFTSGNVQDAGHPLVQNVSFNDWTFIESGQQTVKNNVTFDAAVASSFTGPNWRIIVTTPAEDFVSGAGQVFADADVIIAEYIDPRSGASLVVNQGAYYQATFGDLTDQDAIRLTDNVVSYIKQLNSR